jgi:hypothetical protein
MLNGVCCLDGLSRGCKSVDGIHVAQAREQRQAAVTMVVILLLT